VAAKKGKKPMAARRRRRKTTTKRRVRRNPATKKPVRKTSGKKGTGRATNIRVRGKSISRQVSNRVRTAKRKSVTYRRYKGGGAAVILRAGNPADQPKMIAVFSAGVLTGIATSAMLDRWIATRATSQTKDQVLYGKDASEAIQAKADGMRIFAQVAAGGLIGVGAYAARKKAPMLTAYLAGFAGAHLVKAGVMVVCDHVLPALFKSKKAQDAGDRYFPDRQTGSGANDGPRRFAGRAPRPFPGKPAPIGPAATGSVGGCGTCNRTNMIGGCPTCGEADCSCNVFPKSPEVDCLRRVSGSPGGSTPVPVPVPRKPPSFIPTDPGGVPGREPGGGPGREVPGGGPGREVPGNLPRPVPVDPGRMNVVPTQPPPRIVQPNNPFVKRDFIVQRQRPSTTVY